MFGPGIPGRSVRCGIILGVGVHVSHADEVRQPARLGNVSNITATNSVMGRARDAPGPPSNQAQKMKDRNTIVGEMLSPRPIIRGAARRIPTSTSTVAARTSITRKNEGWRSVLVRASEILVLPPTGSFRDSFMT